MPTVSADIRECPQDQVLTAHKKYGGVAHLISALHASGRDVSASSDAMPTGEEVGSFPLENFGRRVGLGREHPAFTEWG